TVVREGKGLCQNTVFRESRWRRGGMDGQRHVRLRCWRRYCCDGRLGNRRWFRTRRRYRWVIGVLPKEFSDYCKPLPDASDRRMVAAKVHEEAFFLDSQGQEKSLGKVRRVGLVGVQVAPVGEKLHGLHILSFGR